MTQAEAVRADQRISCGCAPPCRQIPMAAPAADLRVRHGGYDIRGAQMDPEVVLPRTRLRELAAEEVIGQLHATAYSVCRGRSAETADQQNRSAVGRDAERGGGRSGAAGPGLTGLSRVRGTRRPPVGGRWDPNGCGGRPGV